MEGGNTRTGADKQFNETQTKFNHGPSPTPNSMVQMMPNYGKVVKGISAQIAERNLNRGIGRNSSLKRDSPRYEE